jgi:hypothetical protein
MVDTGLRACPVCGQNANVSNLPPPMIDGYRIECPRCGNFIAPGLLLRTVLKGKDSDSEANELLPHLSAYIRQANARGENVALDESWRDFARAHKNTPFSRKVTKLLELLVDRSNPELGNPVTIQYDNDWPLVDAGSDFQLIYLLRHLEQKGYLEVNAPQVYTLLPAAWESLEKAGLGQGIPGKCFVAMSFHKDLKDAYEKGIFLAVKEDCKMDPMRMDLVEHNEKICDKMVAEIRTCQFLVADVTLQRPNVYFEGGFAMGLGRPVIWTCREDDRKQVQFDTRQYNHIFWKYPKDLRTKLCDRIRATIPMSS